MTGRPIGELNKRVRFEREDRTPGPGGSATVQWVLHFSCWARFRPERGIERIEAGRTTAPLMGTLIVRSSTETRSVTATRYRLVMDSAYWQIRSVANPDSRNFEIEMTVERGVNL